MSKSKSIKSNVIYEDGFFMGEKDIKIYYKSYEVEDSEDVIVISHGFCESSEKYRELINVEDFNYYIKDLKTFLDSIVVPNLNDRKLYLFAHSMGGAIGALFLEKHNNYFEKAILNCPMMEIDTGKYPKIVSKIVSKLFCTIGMGNKYLFGHRPFNSKPDFINSATSSRKRYDSYFNKQLEHKELQTSGGSFNWLNQAFKGIKELLKEENIQNIKADVLLFQAGKDTFVKPNGHNKFVSLAKNCEFVRFEDAKHEIYIEKDEIFNPYIEKVLGFYDK